MDRRNLKCLVTALLIIGGHGKDITTSVKASQTGNNVPIKDAENSASQTGLPNDQSASKPSIPAVGNPPPSDIERSGFGFGSDWFNDFNFNTNFHSTLNCSEPNNPSLLFNIGVDGTGYPVTAVNAEIAARQDFGRFLVMEIPGPVVVPPDPVFDTANRTCPGVALNVFSFNSPTRGACWVVQGFQDPLFSVTCQLGDCIGCSNAHTSTTSHVGSSLTFKYRCIPQYRSISVWAYCPLIGFPAIVREQVIVPSFCSCVQTPCVKTTTSSGW